METKIIKIGNSRGIRIPDVLLKLHGLSGRVRLVNTVKGLLITPEKPRMGWREQFERAVGDSVKDEPLLDMGNKFDEEEWEW
jgi:antitoxin MazE